MESEASPQNGDGIDAGIRALITRQTGKAVLDTLLEHKSALIDAENAGVPALVICNYLKSQGVITASYDTFVAAMRQFRSLVGLPVTNRKQARRLKVVGAPLPAEPTEPPRTPPGARGFAGLRVPSNIPADIPPNTHRSLAQIALEKADAPGLQAPGAK